MTAPDRLVSYAQHGEDVVLARALGGRAGFYVDVGAGSPDRASVTRHFYEAGWTGIHIEPRAELAAQLRASRPRDRVVQAALGDTTGVVTLYRVQEDGDLSTIDADRARELRDEGFAVVAGEVPVRTLDSVLEQAAPARIDFLKIDVEGAEAAVLRGVDLRRWAPRVLVVEATRPNSSEASHQEWEGLLLDQGYEFASTDGLNRFYARGDLAGELGPRLVPANPTDHYVPAGVLLLEEEVDRLRAYVARVEQELAAKSERLARVESDGVRAALPPLRTAAPTPSADDVLPVRVALLGTPMAGSTWLGTMLAEVLSAERAVVQHPADLTWDALPERLVLELPWHPTELLRRLLRAQDMTVVSVARHPFDVLLSVLALAQRDAAKGSWLAGEGGGEECLLGASPNEEAFLRWAEGPRAAALLSLTPQWWREQDTIQVRYEELVAAPEDVLGSFVSRALRRTSVPPRAELLAARVRDAVSNQSQDVPLFGSGDRGDPRARTGGWQEVLLAPSVERLATAHPGVCEALGYPTPGGELRHAAGVVAPWHEPAGPTGGTLR